MLVHPATVLGLGDGGAHCGVLCDASLPTFMLTHWARDRSRGERLPVETVVHLQTRRTAELYGFRDRGLLAPGHLADVNVIDHGALALERARDGLRPAGVGQAAGAAGPRATWRRSSAGTVVREHDEATGERPGRLLRGPSRSPDPPAPPDRIRGPARRGRRQRGPQQRVGEAAHDQRRDALAVGLEDVAHGVVGPAEVDVDVDGDASCRRPCSGPGSGRKSSKVKVLLGVVGEDGVVPACGGRRRRRRWRRARTGRGAARRPAP